MRPLLLGALLLLAATAAADETYENPRFVSPGGEMAVVVRLHPRIGDFVRMSYDEFWREDPVEAWLNAVPLEPGKPPEPKPVQGALYRIWPGGYRELLAEFDFRRGERLDPVLVGDDGHFVTTQPVGCNPDAELLTIRAADGSIVRTLGVLDVLTRQDQRWLCRGNAGDVRFSMGETLRMTVLVTDGKWDAPEARHETIDIDLATGAVPAPERNRCPAALLVIPEAEDGPSQALLARATVRVLPEYPEVASKARIEGSVKVEVTVGTDGLVKVVRMVKPLPFGLDQAVHDAVMKWEFAPADAPMTGVFAFRFEIVRDFRILSTHVVN